MMYILSGSCGLKSCNLCMPDRFGDVQHEQKCSRKFWQMCWSFPGLGRCAVLALTIYFGELALSNSSLIKQSLERYPLEASYTLSRIFRKDVGQYCIRCFFTLIFGLMCLMFKVRVKVLDECWTFYFSVFWLVMFVIVTLLCHATLDHLTRHSQSCALNSMCL